MYKFRRPLDTFFKRCKVELVCRMPKYFDYKLDIIIAANASYYGIGAVILNKFKRWKDKSDCSYFKNSHSSGKELQSNREGGTCNHFRCEKFDRFIHSRILFFFFLITNRPSLGRKKGIPTFAVNSLQ